MLSLILGATLATSTTLMIEGVATTVSLWGICRGFNGVLTKTSYSFKH